MKKLPVFIKMLLIFATKLVRLVGKNKAFLLMKPSYLLLGSLFTAMLFYYFVFESLDRYEQSHVSTSFEMRVNPNQTEKPQNIETKELEKEKKAKFLNEMQKIKNSANEAFIINTLNENLNKLIHNAQLEQTIKKISMEEKSKQNTKVTKQDSIQYVPYRMINTHDIRTK